ncbi:MAG: hypothetical protein HOQ28_20370 [Thermoleophilia bacterium]|nr:hypothetical protein [Thermoleophilia bacterium]
MRKLVVLGMLLLPVGAASAGPAEPLLLFTTTVGSRGSDVVVSQLDERAGRA